MSTSTSRRTGLGTVVESWLDLFTLADIVRHRFPGADAVVCTYAASDTTLWQVLAGGTVIWNAMPDVQDEIPEWAGLPDAALALHKVMTARARDIDEPVTVRLPTEQRRAR